ncbi:MAG: DUF4760 domain-containing protein [Candidatus Acidiferrum sp.]
MPKKPTADDAHIILELYDLRREAEMRKARQWWTTTFWPANADDFMKVSSAAGTDENRWLRQVLGYWGIAASFVANGVLSEKMFLEPSFCGECFFILAKVRPFLKELREKMHNPQFFHTVEEVVLGSKLGKTRFAAVEARVLAMRAKQ